MKREHGSQVHLLEVESHFSLTRALRLWELWDDVAGLGVWTAGCSHPRLRSFFSAEAGQPSALGAPT